MLTGLCLHGNSLYLLLPSQRGSRATILKDKNKDLAISDSEGLGLGKGKVRVSKVASFFEVRYFLASITIFWKSTVSFFSMRLYFVSIFRGGYRGVLGVLKHPPQPRQHTGFNGHLAEQSALVSPFQPRNLDLTCIWLQKKNLFVEWKSQVSLTSLDSCLSH